MSNIIAFDKNGFLVCETQPAANNEKIIATINHGIYEISFTQKQIEDMYENLDLVREACLYLINPEVCENSDCYFETTTEDRQALYEYYKQTSYSKDFIEKIFKTQSSHLSNKSKLSNL